MHAHSASSLTLLLPLQAVGSVSVSDTRGVGSEDVRAAARGDVEAFGRLYHIHVPRVHLLARHLVGSDNADEATQDVFVRAWSKLDTFRGDAQFSTWLHRLAVNVLIRRSRSLRREEKRDTALPIELVHPQRTDLHTMLDLDTALSALDEAQRQVVVLHDMEGYSHEEIAQLLSIGVSASRMRLSRARLALRAFMTHDK